MPREQPCATTSWCPTDGSSLPEEAVSHAIAFAAETGAKATFVTVTDPERVAECLTPPRQATRVTLVQG